MVHIEDLSTDTPQPHDDSFHEELTSLISEIRPFSEDLYETEYFLEKNWLQVSPDEKIARLHIFRAEGEYLESIDGNVLNGRWSIIESSNNIILEHLGPNQNSEQVMYELAFLNEDFFILKKHGNRRGFENQFLLLGREPLVNQLEWEEVVDMIYTRSKNNRKLIRAIILLIALIVFYFVYASL